MPGSPTQLSRTILTEMIVCSLATQASALSEAIFPIWQIDTKEIFLNPLNWQREGRALASCGYEYIYKCQDVGLIAIIKVASDDRTIDSVNITYDPKEALSRVTFFSSPPGAPWPGWDSRSFNLTTAGRDIAAALIKSQDKQIRLLGISIVGKASLPTTGSPKDVKLKGLGTGRSENS